MDLKNITDYFFIKLDQKGISQVKILFQKWDDARVTYEVNGNVLNFLISDLLIDMPESDIIKMLDMYMEMQINHNFKFDYNNIEYIKNRQIVVEKQHLCMERLKIEKVVTKGDVYDLNEIARDLVKRGLIDREALNDTIITYVDHLNDDQMGNADRIFRIVRINRALDSENYPNIVIDSTLFHELIHIEIGLDEIDMHGEEFSRRMNLYDRINEFNDWAYENGNPYCLLNKNFF